MVTVIVIAFICAWSALYSISLSYQADDELFVIPTMFIIIPASFGLFLFLTSKYAPWFLS